MPYYDISGLSTPRRKGFASWAQAHQIQWIEVGPNEVRVSALALATVQHRVRFACSLERLKNLGVIGLRPSPQTRRDFAAVTAEHQAEAKLLGHALAHALAVAKRPDWAIATPLFMRNGAQVVANFIGQRTPEATPQLCHMLSEYAAKNEANGRLALLTDMIRYYNGTEALYTSDGSGLWPVAHDHRVYAEDCSYVTPYSVGWRMRRNGEAVCRVFFGEDDADDEDDDHHYESDNDDNDYDLPEGMYAYHSNSTQRRTAVKFHSPRHDDALAGDNITLGMECELNVSDRRTFVAEVRGSETLRSVCVMEEDGSLDSYKGVETIFGWSTLGTVKHWATQWAAIATDIGYDVDSCGLHIAVPVPMMPNPSTESYDMIQDTKYVARVMGFIYNPNNDAFIRAIAGRPFGSHCGKPSALEGGNTFKRGSSYAKGGIQDTPSITARKAIKSRITGENNDRYQAINLRSGGGKYDGTMEFRLFKGTGSAGRLQARLEFVWALMKYCDPLMLMPLDATSFCQALVRDKYLRTHTPVLRQYLCSARAQTPPKQRAILLKFQEMERVKKERFAKIKKPA